MRDNKELKSKLDFGQGQEERFTRMIESLPINPARDLYGIEDKRVQAISYISSRAMEEGVRKKDYAIASNAIGAWLITVGEQLNILGRDRSLPAIFSADLVDEIPDIARIARMIADYMRPWYKDSKDASVFFRNIVCRQETHPLVVLCFLSMVPKSLAEPWVRFFYDRVIDSATDTQKMSLFTSLQDGLEAVYLSQPYLMGARRTVYNDLAKRFSRYYPKGDYPKGNEKRPALGKNRILFLTRSFDEESLAPLSLLKPLLAEWEQGKAQGKAAPEIAIFETREGVPAKNQLGFMRNDDNIPKATLGQMVRLRKQVKFARNWDISQNLAVNFRELMSACYNFNPTMVVALDMPCSVLKGSLKQYYPMVDWLTEDSYAMALGHHVMATSNEIEARMALLKANFAKLDDDPILALPEDIKGIADCFLNALHATQSKP